MTPRRLIRWKTFWFGILVLGFLAWVWMRSAYHETVIDYGYGSRAEYLRLVVGEGNVGLGWQEDPFPDSGFSISEDILAGEMWLPTNAVFIHDSGFVDVALWLLMLLFLIPWSAFLAWRWNKQRKLREANA